MPRKYIVEVGRKKHKKPSLSIEFYVPNSMLANDLYIITKT